MTVTLEWSRMELRYGEPGRARQMLHDALGVRPDDGSLLEQLVRLTDHCRGPVPVGGARRILQVLLAV